MRQSIGNSVARFNQKVFAQVSEMADGVEKWKEAGRLASVDTSRECNFAAGKQG